MDARKSKVKGIYRWVFPNGRRYIGRAANFKGRREHYISDIKNLKENRYVIRALRKYGIENCRYEIVEIVNDNISEDQFNLKESLWIKYYQSNNKKFGYNLAAFSNSCTGFKHTKETKRKMSLSRMGKPGGMLNKNHSEETKKKISETSKNYPNKGVFKKGHRNSNETRIKISIASKGRKILSLNKPINQLDLAGNFIKRWESVSDANISLGKPFKSSVITLSIKRNGTSCGFKWEYVGKEKTKEEYLKPRNKFTGLKINQLTLDGEVIKKWNSMSLASKNLGRNNCTPISDAIKNNKPLYGYRWEYADKENV